MIIELKTNYQAGQLGLFGLTQLVTGDIWSDGGTLKIV